MMMKKNNKLIENIETLYAFENNKIAIAEFKRTDLDDSSSPEDRFYWLKHDKVNDEVMRLKFVSMSSLKDKEERVFLNEKLVFDLDTAILSNDLASDEELASVDISSMSGRSKNKFVEFFVKNGASRL